MSNKALTILVGILTVLVLILVSKEIGVKKPDAIKSEMEILKGIAEESVKNA